MARMKQKTKVVAVTFDSVEDFLDIFVEQLVTQAQEEDYQKAQLKKFVLRRIEEIYSI